jgi:tryptophan synthase alpha chain
MKSAITESIIEAREAGGCAFIPYLTAGFPDIETSADLLDALWENGADVIEIGLPVVDPFLDGPTIRMSHQRALENGVTVDDVLRLAADARTRSGRPVVLMTYSDPVFRMGLPTFAARARDAGIDGVIIPDLPPEEPGDWVEAAEANGLDTIFLVDPTVGEERLRRIASKTRGFLYFATTTGVTGAPFAVSEELLGRVGYARTVSPVPVAVGFGISESEQARALTRVADGVIVGSAFIRAIAEKNRPAEQVGAVSRLAASLSAALEGTKR